MKYQNVPLDIQPLFLFCFHQSNNHLHLKYKYISYQLKEKQFLTLDLNQYYLN